MREKLKNGAPDVLSRPRVSHYRVLDFYKMNEIFKDVDPFKEEFKRQVAAKLEAAAKVGVSRAEE